jgi:hypothetical protein
VALMTTVIAIAVSSCAALVSWKVLEKPCPDLKRHFSYLGVSRAATARA